MENNENQFKYKTSYLKSDHSFVKSFIIPFFAGLLGTLLIIGIFYVFPEIGQKLFKLESSSNNSGTTDSISTSSSINDVQISLTKYSDTAISVASEVLPSIVGIEVEYNVSSFFSKTSSASAEGSGIIISEDGYILTNNHIVNTSSSSSYYEVSEATKVIVHLYNDETDYEAKIIGTDSVTDLAVIKIEKAGLKAAELGDSDSVQIGEFAMAIGNPLGMQSSVTCGIISALNREVLDSDGKTYVLIQTDAAINSGNSGGALVNSKGQVIGINTLKLAGDGIEGMGFAIPINSTTEISNELIEHGKILRPYIGITGVDISQSDAERYHLVVGVYIDSIENFSPAAKSDLKQGDIILKINDTQISTIQELNNIKNTLKIGDTIKLTINRSGEELTISLVLEEQP